MFKNFLLITSLISVIKIDTVHNPSKRKIGLLRLWASQRIVIRGGMGTFSDLIGYFGIIVDPILNGFNQFLKLLFNDMPVLFGLRPGGWLLLFLTASFLYNLIMGVIND